MKDFQSLLSPKAHREKEKLEETESEKETKKGRN